MKNFKKELIDIIKAIDEGTRTEEQDTLLNNLEGTNNFDFGRFRRLVEPLALAMNKDRKKSSVLKYQNLAANGQRIMICGNIKLTKLQEITNIMI